MIRGLPAEPRSRARIGAQRRPQLTPAATNGSPVTQVAERAIAASPIATYLTSVRVGALERAERLVRTFGMVSATRDFTERPQVINSFNDLRVKVFGDDTGKEIPGLVRSGR